jgi:hypothetical protein
MPSIYQLLPPPGAPAMVDSRGDDVKVNVLDPAVWRRFRWGAFGSLGQQRLESSFAEKQVQFVAAALERAQLFHEVLSRPPDTPCPVRVIAMGGDCLPTLARAIMPERPGQIPRFAPLTPAESHVMYEAGDERVTRASVLAAHLPSLEEEYGCGIPEVARCFFGSADHHGIYQEPTFQNLLLRLILRPSAAEQAATQS